MIKSDLTLTKGNIRVVTARGNIGDMDLYGKSASLDTLQESLTEVLNDQALGHALVSIGQ